MGSARPWDTVTGGSAWCESVVCVGGSAWCVCMT